MVFWLPVCVCVALQASLDEGGWKSEMEFLELELQMVVGHRVGIRGKPWSSARTASALNL